MSKTSRCSRHCGQACASAGKPHEANHSKQPYNLEHSNGPHVGEVDPNSTSRTCQAHDELDCREHYHPDQNSYMPTIWRFGHEKEFDAVEQNADDKFSKENHNGKIGMLPQILHVCLNPVFLLGTELQRQRGWC